MPDRYGEFYSGTDPLKMAPGTSVDAGVRRFRNRINLATNGGGGTTDPILLARVREGCHVYQFQIASDTNLSAVNFTIGTKAVPAKYCAAFAGPAANASVSPTVKVAELLAEPLAAPEEIWLFPAANTPAAGLVATAVLASKR